jgi:hypothetical protein
MFRLLPAPSSTMRSKAPFTSRNRVESCNPQSKDLSLTLISSSRGVPSHQRGIVWLASTSNRASAREESRLAVDLATHARVGFPKPFAVQCRG